MCAENTQSWVAFSPHRLLLRPRVRLLPHFCVGPANPSAVRLLLEGRDGKGANFNIRG